MTKSERALELMEYSDRHIFLTGKAGTGKSTLLRKFRLETKKTCAFLAPTGVAAINIKGETIHSFFNIKPGYELQEVTKNFHCKNPRLYQRLQTIVIDEASMVRADILDAIDIYLKKVRKDSSPFGGVQMIFVGDLYQLPPVLTSHEKQAFYKKYPSPFFFSSQVFGEGEIELEVVELDKIYRQEDKDFIEILNKIRTKEIEENHLEILNQRSYVTTNPNKKYIHLCTTNKSANYINHFHLSSLSTHYSEFEADFKGDLSSLNLPNSHKLKLKEGAQVMFTVNDSERRFVNGTIGTVVGMDDILEIVEVELEDGNVIEVTPHQWEISKYIMDGDDLKRETIGSVTQIPLRLAWAITIHKSQGKTFDNVVIDLGDRSFAHGQTYVALSRCRTLEGIVLKRPVRHDDIILNKTVKMFFDYFTKDQYDVF